MGHVKRDHLGPEVIRAPEGHRQVDLTERCRCTRGDAVERHRRTQSRVRNLHPLEEARAQDVESTPPITQHPPHLYVTNGGGDYDGETPYSLAVLGVVSSAKGDRNVRPLQRLTGLERWDCSADLSPK